MHLGITLGIFTRKGFDDSETRSEGPVEPQAPGSGVIPPARPSAPLHVSQERALGIIPVFRSVQIISSAVGSLTVDTWRGTEPTSAPSWIKRPDMKMTRSRFLALTATCLSTQGNAFWRIVRNSPVDPINALVVLNPNEVVVHEDGTFGWRDQILKAWEVQHLQYMPIAGRLLGLGPIQAAQSSLRGAIDLRDYASEWFQMDHVPSGVLTTPQALNNGQAKSYAEQWDERAGRGTAVLGNDLKYQAIMLSPEDALWIEAQQFNVTDIARLFGIPPHLLLAVVEGGSQTYANIGQADLSFVRHGLTTYIREIEEAFSALLPRNNEARFNLDALLRSDTTTRYAAHSQAITSGFLTINKVRALEGLSPLPGGDEITKQAPKETPNEQP
ncbi:phage portal protein [Oerskovia sp. NPDC060338]|uniref:phage portal protein n=1 Tax=Oerskovia sp. NPDC060338 TaxID=3347100 RepID=UPI00365E0FA0